MTNKYPDKQWDKIYTDGQCTIRISYDYSNTYLTAQEALETYLKISKNCLK